MSVQGYLLCTYKDEADLAALLAPHADVAEISPRVFAIRSAIPRNDLEKHIRATIGMSQPFLMAVVSAAGFASGPNLEFQKAGEILNHG